MKRILVVLMVLSIASISNAAVLIGVNGQVNPSSATLVPGHTADISIWSDGYTSEADTFILTIQGPASLDISAATNAMKSNADQDTVEWVMGDPSLGMVFFDYVTNFGTVPNLSYGTLTDNIILHCDGIGDVTLTMWGADTNITYDTQVIHQIPEPMTLGLLGFGGLFLRRRK